MTADPRLADFAERHGIPRMTPADAQAAPVDVLADALGAYWRKRYGDLDASADPTRNREAAEELARHLTDAGYVIVPAGGPTISGQVPVTSVATGGALLPAGGLDEQCPDRCGGVAGHAGPHQSGDWDQSLDFAWKQAEAALPKGSALSVGNVEFGGKMVYWAGAGPTIERPETLIGRKKSPTEALQALATLLRPGTHHRWPSLCRRSQRTPGPARPPRRAPGRGEGRARCGGTAAVVARQSDDAERPVQLPGDRRSPRRAHGGPRMTGMDLIAIERHRQQSEEGYDAAHDAGHADQLATAGACYAIPAGARDNMTIEWPWDYEYWKPTPGDRTRELVKAGALIAAAIDALLTEDPDA